MQSSTNSNAPDGSYVLQEVSLLADPPVFVTSNGYNDTGRLGVGDSAAFTFTIKADGSAADGIYRMTLKVRTSDGDVYLNYPIKLQVESNEPQSCFIGTMASGGTYSADFNVQSNDNAYSTLPQFVLVYKNGDNWHQTAAISAASDPPVKDWWTTWYEGALGAWWPYFVAGALCAIAVAVFGAVVLRRSKPS